MVPRGKPPLSRGVRGFGEASADYTAADVVSLRDVTSERSRLGHVSKHPPDRQERLRSPDSGPIDEPSLRDGSNVFASGVARMIEAGRLRLDLDGGSRRGGVGYVSPRPLGPIWRTLAVGVCVTSSSRLKMTFDLSPVYSPGR